MDAEYEWQISYLSDALGDLTRAVITAATMPIGSCVQSLFADEPGEHRMVIVREADDMIVRIEQSDGYRSSEGMTVFSARCSYLRLATQVAGQLQQIYNAYGLDGYKAKWIEHDFPLMKMLELREVIQKAR